GFTGHEHFFEVGLVHMNGRMYDAKLGRFLSPDNYIQDPFNTQSFNRYGYVWNNPLSITDPDGEIFWAVVGIAAAIGAAIGAITYVLNAAITGDWSWSGFGMSILGGALTGALGGAIAPGMFPALMTSSFFYKAIGVGVLASFIPGLTIPLGNFSISISPSIVFGQAIGIGANISASYQSGNFNISAGIGVSFFGRAYGTGKQGWEYRTSGAIGYNDGNFSLALYSTKFNSGNETSQQVGGISVGYGDWNI